jgi:uncharacterized protein (DUF58 family)
MLAYPSPRLAIIAIVVISAATGGYFYPPLFDYSAIAALAVGFIALIDLWLTAAALKGKLKLRRDFPRAVTVARPRLGHHVLVNEARIPLRFRVYEDSYAHIVKELDVRWRSLGARDSLRTPLRITVNRRGEQELGGAGLRISAGLGLWVLQYRFEWEEQARVYPLIEELTKGDLFAHRRRLWGVGQHQSRKFGRGTEFDSLREYTPDDEYRTVNWKATARAGRPIVNQYQVEQSRDLMLMIDCGRLMHTEIGGRPRLDRYLDAAVHLAYLALSQKDRVGLIAFDAEVRKFVAPTRRPSQLDDLVDSVFDLKPRFTESDYSRAVSTLKAKNPKRGLVVLFTDLVDSVSSRLAVANLSRLAKTHLPVVVILDDPAIPALAEQPALSVEDAYVKGSAEQFISEKQHTLGMLKTRGCLIINVAAERLNTAVVNQYLEVKARNLL